MTPRLTDAEFDRLRALLSATAGLVFEPSRRESVAFCVGERLRRTGIADVATYLTAVDHDLGERQALLDEVTIQETHFFRNPPQIRALRQHVLPELLRHAATRGKRLRIWSAGCSTGEEAYTLAMLVREQLPVREGWDVSLLATDLSQAALATARQGRYGERAVQLATADDRARFFTEVAGGWEVNEEIRSMVTFAHHNLVTSPVPQPGGRLDLVLCRNVTIYFAKPTTRALMTRLHEGLRDGGWLFLGHSETLWQVSEEFRLVTLGEGDGAAFVYRRLDAPAERRSVLPDRRTSEPLPRLPERRVSVRRSARPASAPAPDPLVLARDAMTDGRYDDAAALAAQAAALEPARADAWYVRGRALVEAGHDDQAVVELRKAAYLDPGLGFAHFLLASVLERLGDRAAALREYAAAAETLGTRPEDSVSPELGGRSVAELARLCRSLTTAGRPT